MRIAQSKLQRIKAGLHCSQALLIFVAGCLTLAVMTKAGGYGGSTAFFFALCFLTSPAIIYLVMVPLWSRAWRLNNVYAFLAIDILFAILWFAAFIAVAVWNAKGISKGSPETGSDADGADKDTGVKKDGTCASFGYGNEIKCQVSQATVGFGVIIFLLFTTTSYIAVLNMIEFRKTGVLPNANMKSQSHGIEGRSGEDDPSKDPDPWSTNTDELHNNDRLPYSNHGEDQENLLHRDSDVEAHQPADGMVHPGRRLSYQGSTHAMIPPSYDDNFAPSALSPTGLPMSPNGRLQFPEANYNALR